MACSVCGPGVKIAEIFAAYGRAIAENPKVAIFIAILLNGLLGLNIKWITVSTNYTELYTIQHSQSLTNAKEIEDSFPNIGKMNTYSWQLPRDPNHGSLIITGDILNEEVKREVLQIHHEVLKIEVKTDTHDSYTFKDLCILNDGSCLISGSCISKSAFWTDLTNKKVSYPIHSDPVEGKMVLSHIFGGVETDNGNIVSAKAFKLVYFLRRNNQSNSIQEKWENEFLKTLSNYKTKLTKIHFTTTESKSSGLPKVYIWEPYVFPLILIILITVVFLTILNGSTLYQRGNLGFAAILSALLSVVGSTGLTSAVGVPYNSMGTVIHFVTLGITLLKTYMFLSGLNDAPLTASIPERVAHALKKTGVPIIVTTLCLALSMIVCGFASNLPVVRSFCWLAGSAAVLSFINHIIFFLACVVINERRIAAGRHWCACHTVYSAEEMKSIGIRNKFVLLCCGGKVENEKDNQRSFVDGLFANFLPRILMTKGAPIVVLVLYLLYIGVSIWGCTTVTFDLKGNDVFQKNSPINSYTNMENLMFDSFVPVSINLDKELDYRNEAILTQISQLVKSLRKTNLVHPEYEMNWLSRFQETSDFHNKSGSQYSSSLLEFINRNPEFKNDILFNQNGTEISFSRIHLLSMNLRSSLDQGNFYRQISNAAQYPDIKYFIHSAKFLYYEQFALFDTEFYISLCVSILCTIVLMLVIIPHPIMATYATVCTLSTFVGVIGFLSLWDGALNSFTTMFLSLSIGLASCHSVYVCYLYINIEAFDKGAKVSNVISLSSGPIICSVITFLLCTFAFMFSDNVIIELLFKIVMLVVLCSLFHSLILLPVTITVIGPIISHGQSSHRDMGKTPLFPNKSSQTWSVAGVNALDTSFLPMKLRKSSNNGQIYE